MYLDNIIPFAHRLLRCRLKEGCSALDGTAGKGHDTLVLAQAVGGSGVVWAFDIQQQALEQTQQRLEEANALTQVKLIHDSHEHLNRYPLPELDAAIFNFGWLPGGDKNITTSAPSSVAALQSALTLLKTGGLLLAVVYPGHPAGAQEAQSIEQWAASLPQQEFDVLRYCFANRRNTPPYLLAFEKLPYSQRQFAVK